MLDGWSREAGCHKDTREPLSPSKLKGLHAQWSLLCSNGFEAALSHAAVLVAFLAAFKISELVAGSRNDSSGCILHLADVQLGPRVVQLILHFLKTDQKSKGAVISLGACNDTALCLVLALCQYLAVRGTDGGNLFIQQDRTPLTKYQF